MIALDAPTAACAVRLDLVDAAYTRPGGPEAGRLRLLCVTCPLAEGCLAEAMIRREWGVWGATSDNMRTRHGGVKARRSRAKGAA